MPIPVPSVLGLLQLLFCALPVVFGQQYAGRTIKLTGMPNVTGAEIAFFNIKDANGKNTTLVNYFSLPTTTKKRQDPTKVQRLVIGLTGSNRNPWDYYGFERGALLAATKVNPDINEETVALLAPWFPNTQDSAKIPWNSTTSTSTSDILVWSGVGWASGGTNVFPASQKSVSSYDCLDQIIEYFSNKSIYPNMKEVVVAGHSRGAQMCHRYAAVGKVLNIDTPVVWWVGNPNSFLFFNTTRPLSTSGCSVFDNWPDGLSAYTQAYEHDLAQDRAAVLARYNNRNIALARGLNDFGDASDNCAPKSTGANRGERFINFIKGFPPNSRMTVDYNSGIGHDAANMMALEPGYTRIFLDNWNGNGSRHADFGPRQVAGDDPHPIST